MGHALECILPLQITSLLALSCLRYRRRRRQLVGPCFGLSPPVQNPAQTELASAHTPQSELSRLGMLWAHRDGYGGSDAPPDPVEMLLERLVGLTQRVGAVR